jgi:protein-S-isoprenylcysteine O-methyltransferase Ste14
MSSRGTFSSIIGTSPVHPFLFALAKVAMLVAWGTPLLHLFGYAPLPWWRVPLVLRVFAIGLVASSLLLFALAGRSLGPALRVGLPREETKLATSGLYRVSRHPIYLALFLMSLAACLIYPHPVVIVTALVAVLLHHRIALAEEAFLEKRFGASWLAYKAAVPRYFGVRRGRGR